MVIRDQTIEFDNRISPYFHLIAKNAATLELLLAVACISERTEKVYQPWIAHCQNRSSTVENVIRVAVVRYFF